MVDLTNTQNASESMDLNGHTLSQTVSPTSTIAGVVRSDRSYIVTPMEENTSINPWDPPTSVPEPSLWGLPSEIVAVKMDDPTAVKGWSHNCSLAMRRYFVPYIRDNTNMALLDNLIGSCLTPHFFKVEESEKSGFAGYTELKKRATKQYIYWLNEVRRPHFEKFVNPISPPFRALPENLDWFEELKNIRFDPTASHADYSSTIFSHSDATKAKEVLAAFAFLDIGILEEDIPYKNFLWACETLKFATSEEISSFIQSFQTQIPLIRTWMKTNNAAFGFNQDLHDYEFVHAQVTKLHNKMEDLKGSSFEVPIGASKQLRKELKRRMKRNFFKLAKFQIKAKILVLKIKPLIEKKLKLDVENRVRMMERQFFTFTWERFHALVTWTFPHYFQIIQAPVTAPVPVVA